MEIRELERAAFCRICDEKIERHSDSVFQHNVTRGKAMNIIICEKCCQTIEKMWLEFNAVYEAEQLFK